MKSIALTLHFLDFKLYGIWTAFLIWNAFRGASLIYRFRKKYRVI